MRRCAANIIVLLSVLWLFPHTKAVAGDAAKTPATEKPPELKLLDRYVGTWEGEMTIRPSVWTPAGGKMTERGVVKWVLAGKYLQINSTAQPDNVEAMHLITYDPEAKEYRHWSFSTNGKPFQSVGQYNAQTKTFTWAADLGDGVKSAVTDRWISDDMREWSVLVKDREGKVLYDMSAKSSRRK